MPDAGSVQIEPCWCRPRSLRSRGWLRRTTKAVSLGARKLSVNSPRLLRNRGLLRIWKRSSRSSLFTRSRPTASFTPRCRTPSRDLVQVRSSWRCLLLWGQESHGSSKPLGSLPSNQVMFWHLAKSQASSISRWSHLLDGNQLSSSCQFIGSKSSTSWWSSAPRKLRSSRMMRPWKRAPSRMCRRSQTLLKVRPWTARISSPFSDPKKTSIWTCMEKSSLMTCVRLNTSVNFSP